MRSLEAQWAEFHEQNPGFYVLFCRFAFEALRAGRRRLSANMIFERIRWETAVSREEEDYKANNNYRAYYARFFMADQARPGVFGTRALSSPPASMVEEN